MMVKAKLIAAALAVYAAPSFADEPTTAAKPEFDYAAREQQVASGDMRIQPLKPAQASSEMRALTKEMRAFFRLKGKITVANSGSNYPHPSLLYNQVKIGLDLNRFGMLPPRQRELVILRTAWLVRSPLEWGEHVVYGKRLGLTSEEIERITQGSSAPGWNAHDQAMLRGVEELLSDHAVSDATWATLAKSWNEQQLIELPGLVGAYTMTAMLYNSLRVGLRTENSGFAAR